MPTSQIYPVDTTVDTVEQASGLACPCVVRSIVAALLRSCLCVAVMTLHKYLRCRFMLSVISFTLLVLTLFACVCGQFSVAYEKKIASVIRVSSADGKPKLDLVMLGMGPDGHTVRSRPVKLVELNRFSCARLRRHSSLTTNFSLKTSGLCGNPCTHLYLRAQAVFEIMHGETLKTQGVSVGP